MVVINTSIGLRPVEIAEILQQRDANLKQLKAQMDEQDAIYLQLKDDVDALKTHLKIGNATAANSTQK